MVGQCAIVGEGDVFLLPLLVQRTSTSLPQDALSGHKNSQGQWTNNRQLFF